MGVAPRPIETLEPSTRKIYDLLKTRRPSPRVRHAIRLYESGAVPTKKAAAEAMGLSPSTLYVNTMPSQAAGTEIEKFRADIDAVLYDRTVTMSRVLSLMSREAVGVIHDTMRTSESESLRLKAAVDLADRAPETSKTQKIAAVGVTLTGKDVNELAKVMAESAAARADYEEIGQDDFVRLHVDEQEALPHHAQRELARAEVEGNVDS